MTGTLGISVILLIISWRVYKAWKAQLHDTEDIDPYLSEEEKRQEALIDVLEDLPKLMIGPPSTYERDSRSAGTNYAIGQTSKQPKKSVSSRHYALISTGKN